MFEIKENQRILPDGARITTYARGIYNCNVLSVEAGTTGYMGGDTGHGGRTYFRIKDEGGTDLKARVSEDKFGSESVEVFLGGDAELDTIITALRFIAKVLEDQKNDVHD